MSHPSPRRLALAAGALATVLVATTAPAAAQAPENVRIAVVDLERVVMQSAAGKDLQSKLETFQQQAQAEAERMNEQARDVRRRMTEGVNSLSEEKLTELQKQFEDLTIAIRRFRDDKQREGQKMQTEGLREIERQLEPIFERVRDELQLDLILNNVPGVVVMANENADITDEVIARLNVPAGNAG